MVNYYEKHYGNLYPGDIAKSSDINQIAIVDSSTVGDASTTFFAASVTEEFYKNEKLALVFVIEVTM